MNDTFQTPGTDEMVFKYTTALQAFKVGVFGVGMGLILLPGYFKPGGPFPGLPPWSSSLYLVIVIAILGSGFVAVFSARWVTVTINSSLGQILVVKKGLIRTHQTFNSTDVASVALHRIWQMYLLLPGNRGEIHDQQLCIVLKNGVRIPLKNEVNERPDTVETDVSLGTRAAQLMNVPFERTGPS